MDDFLPFHELGPPEQRMEAVELVQCFCGQEWDEEELTECPNCGRREWEAMLPDERLSWDPMPDIE